ncbi:MAG: Na+/H+ antiporter subunit E [Thermodesulfobacteriota bacterium]
MPTEQNKIAGLEAAGLVKRTVTPALIFSLIWFVMVGGDSASWIIGGPMVLIAVVLSLILADNKAWNISFRGGLLFAPYFLFQSTASGFDVLRRTFSLKLKINPGLISYKTSLPEGTPRVLLVNTISLMPGTLSADLRDELIVVHTLDVNLPVWAGIQRLETRIALLFSLDSTERLQP